MYFIPACCLLDYILHSPQLPPHAAASSLPEKPWERSLYRPSTAQVTYYRPRSALAPGTLSSPQPPFRLYYWVNTVFAFYIDYNKREHSDSALAPGTLSSPQPPSRLYYWVNTVTLSSPSRRTSVATTWPQSPCLPQTPVRRQKQRSPRLDSTSRSRYSPGRRPRLPSPPPSGPGSSSRRPSVSRRIASSPAIRSLPRARLTGRSRTSLSPRTTPVRLKERKEGGGGRGGYGRGRGPPRS